MKRGIFLFLAAFFAAFGVRADVISDFTSSHAVSGPNSAVLVMDLKSGEVLASHNPDMPLLPASIMKAVTTATLLEKVGSKFHYETPVLYNGVLSNGTICGDIIVKGSGDPSINTVHAPGSEDLVSEIVNALKSLRVDSVAGCIVIDESDFPGPVVNPAWQLGDLGHAYGTGTHGFNFEDNASGKKSVADPAGVFKTRLKSAMQKAGIGLGGNESSHREGNRRVLLNHKSERIDDIMRSCMMRSDNQFAEAFMRTVGLKYGQNGSTATGTQEAMKYWKRNNAHMDGVKIVDGSGLSRSNRVTARFMSDVLKKMSTNPYYASFFPLTGQEGTVRKFMAGTKLEGELALKTGSMNGIQCYAGYKLDNDYRPTHIVVVIMNNMGDRTAARASVQKMLLSIFYPQPETQDIIKTE